MVSRITLRQVLSCYDMLGYVGLGEVMLGQVRAGEFWFRHFKPL
jgi:hypothetical protein